METIKKKLTELNQLVLEGKALDAFDKYYHPEVVMQENENQPTVGKSENRKREEEFFKSIVEFKEAKPLKITIGNDVSMVEWYYNYIHQDWGVRNYTQVSVQEWQDGLIIREKFYYNS